MQGILTALLDITPVLHSYMLVSPPHTHLLLPPPLPHSLGSPAQDALAEGGGGCVLKQGSGGSATTRWTLLLLVSRGPGCHRVLVGRLGSLSPAAGLGLHQELSVVLKRRLRRGGCELSVVLERLLGRSGGRSGGCRSRQWGGRRGDEPGRRLGLQQLLMFPQAAVLRAQLV